MRSVKEKVCPCAHNTHKDRILQAVSTGFMCAFVCKASVRWGGKFLLCGKKARQVDSVGVAVLRRLYARTCGVADELFAAPKKAVSAFCTA